VWGCGGFSWSVGWSVVRLVGEKKQNQNQIKGANSKNGMVK
jgi:hypothetical protein